MKFSEYCDMVQNTDKEFELIQFLNDNDGIHELRKVLPKLKRIPVVGKAIEALMVLADYESLEEFKQTEHYANVANMGFSFNPEKSSLNLSPSSDQVKQLAVVGLAAVAVIVILVMCFRKCRR